MAMEEIKLPEYTEVEEGVYKFIEPFHVDMDDWDCIFDYNVCLFIPEKEDSIMNVTYFTKKKEYNEKLRKYRTKGDNLYYNQFGKDMRDGLLLGGVFYYKV